MASTRSVFGSIKEKLGLDNQQQAQQYDEYDEYDEYEDYEDEAQEDEDPGYSTRSVGGFRSSFSSGLPSLLSRSEVEERTRSNRSISLTESIPSRSHGREMVDSSLPPSMTPEGTAAVSAASNRRSEGLDSLFSSTAPASTPSVPVIGAAASALSSVAGRRKLKVMHPSSYEDAADVTSTLKVGDVAVLVLKGVPDSLAHRMMDFSFGAASALDATVDCVADKTFVICRGDALSDAERANLMTQGIL
ncbi:MAG: cell division protein SepF [Eggerthellaceae bacterium]|nr:cell division protein SepF [Eggerthellaceae bacterium]